MTRGMGTRALALAWVGAALGCGGGGGSAPAPTPAVSVTVAPDSATVGVGAARQFTATVANTSDTAVAWSVVEGGGGAVSASGLYTAPATAGTYHVKATSHADASKSAQAAVTVTAVPTGAPVISTFVATPDTVWTGGSTALAWSVAGADTLSLDQGIGAVTGTSRTVSPAATTTYTLSATNASGTVTAPVTVTVAAPLPGLPVISAFSASPAAITDGQSTTLSWTVTGATALRIDGGVSDVSGTSTTVSPSVSTTYTLTAANALGNVTARATVTVARQAGGVGVQVSPASVTLAPGGTRTFTASVSGSSSQAVGWSVVNGGQVTQGAIEPNASGGGDYTAPLFGGTYKVRATSKADPSKSADATVTVTPAAGAPTIAAFTVTPTTILEGDTALLQWNVSGATTVDINQGVGVGTLPGTSVVVKPGAGTTVYTLSASNASGGVRANATLTVNHRPAGIKVAVTPPQATVAPGGAANFSAAVSGSADPAVTWSVKEAGGGSITPSGAYTAPATPGVYTVVAKSHADPTKLAEVMVAVNSATDRSFLEPFTWRGNHAATITAANSLGDPGHLGTTIWWNPESWEVRGDTAYLATSYISSPSGTSTGFHVDIHKAATGDPKDGDEDNGVFTVGGDGSPGVAAMRMDYQGIHSARLRNPMLISSSRPGVVGFYAPRFVTTGHWWEVSITPADRIIGAENTYIPVANAGHNPAEESINLICIGSNDIPCDQGGYKTAFQLSYHVGSTFEDIQPLPGDPEIPTDPSEKEELYHWELRYKPDGIDLFADLDHSGALVLQKHWAKAIPWPEVHVHLLGVAYQADHHPQGNCYLGEVRELNWRNVYIGPLKYGRTSVAPRDGVTTNTGKVLGWVGHDLRDIQRFGPDVLGYPQPNTAPWASYGSMAFASIDLGAFDQAKPSVPEVNLPVDLPASQVASASAVQLIYDIKGQGSASLYVNGTLVGTLPSIKTIAVFNLDPSVDNLLATYGHRGLAVPLGLLHAGRNTIRVVMAGEVVMDRLQLEFYHP